MEVFEMQHRLFLSQVAETNRLFQETVDQFNQQQFPNQQVAASSLASSMGQQDNSAFDAEYAAIKVDHERIAREIAQAHEELEKNRKFF